MHDGSTEGYAFGVVRMSQFFTVDFLEGLAIGTCFVIHCWASEKAFGKWWMGMAIIFGYSPPAKVKQ